MALAAKAILKGLPDSANDRKIVYGLHLDGKKLRILAHFMNDPGRRPESQWEFCQVVLAQHWVTTTWDPVISYYCHTEDNTFLDRWGIVRALFTIRREIGTMRKLFPTDFQPTDSSVWESSPRADPPR